MVFTYSHTFGSEEEVANLDFNDKDTSFHIEQEKEVDGGHEEGPLTVYERQT